MINESVERSPESMYQKSVKLSNTPTYKTMEWLKYAKRKSNTVLEITQNILTLL